MIVGTYWRVRVCFFLSFSLQEPTSNLDTFDGYQLFISPPPPPPLTSPVFAPKTPVSGTHILQGLANFTVYTVTVATFNQDGVGPLTAMDSIMTPETGTDVLGMVHLILHHMNV